MLPIVAALVSQGLGLLGNAVMAKGKEVIEEKIGVNLEEAMQSPEGLQKLRQLEMDHEEFLLTNALENRKLDLEQEKVELADTANARESNVKIQESPNASWLAKNAIYIIAFVVVVGGGLMIAMSSQADARMAAVSAVMLVLGFFFGTTHNSSRKDTTIANLSQGGSK
jgi:hypothetical protein